MAGTRRHFQRPRRAQASGFKPHTLVSALGSPVQATAGVLRNGLGTLYNIVHAGTQIFPGRLYRFMSPPPWSGIFRNGPWWGPGSRSQWGHRQQPHRGPVSRGQMGSFLHRLASGGSRASSMARMARNARLSDPFD